jgi:hypothetical protein
MIGRIVAGALLCACSSRLPDLAVPKQQSMSDVSSNPDDLIRYRKLERSDFQRKAPPEVYKQGPYEIGAQTCAVMRTSPDVRISYQSTPSGEFEGHVENLHFYAEMDRACSWWNPKSKDEAYVLQHEQVHFALFEIEVRRMNREARDFVEELRVTADTEKEVVAQIQAELDDFVKRHNEAVFERNHAFDEDTSVGRNPKKQQEWFEQIQRELGELEKYR